MLSPGPPTGLMVSLHIATGGQYYLSHELLSGVVGHS